MLNIYVTGSDFNSGKTFVATGLAATMQSLGYNTSFYKSVEVATDGILKNATDLMAGLEPFVKRHSSFNIKEKYTPLISSELEGTKIEFPTIQRDFRVLNEGSDCLVMESEGGISAPLGINLTNLTMAKSLKVPLLYVVSPFNDTISDILSSINLATANGIKVQGVILNQFSGRNHTDWPRMIEEYSDTKILGIINRLNKPSEGEIITSVLNGIDIEGVFNVKIEKLGLE